jgi:hypothetical protein
MRRVLVIAAVSEAATGAALLLAPSLVGQLLLGTELAGIAVTVARVAGIALVALGVACWPGTPLLGMLTYSASVTQLELSNWQLDPAVPADAFAAAGAAGAKPIAFTHPNKQARPDLKPPATGKPSKSQ